MEYDRAALKQQVRTDLRETRPRAILVTLVYLIAVFLITSLVEYIGSRSAPAGAMQQLTELFRRAALETIDEDALLQGLIEVGGSLGQAARIGILTGIVSAVVSCTLNFGYEGYCLSMVRRQDPGYGRLLCALPQWGWVLLTALLVGLFTTLWSILFCVLAVIVTTLAFVFLEDNLALAATLTVVSWIAALCGMTFIALRYVMADFILMDEKVDALEAIRRSKAMMRGRKWHYFVLGLSFIGWYLLLGLIVGVVSTVATAVTGGTVAAAGGDPMEIIAGMAGSFGVATVVSALAAIPLNTWLQCYVMGSCAKFYDQMKETDRHNGVWESDRDYHAPCGQGSYPPPPPLQVPPEPPAPPAPGAPDRPNYE